MRRDGLALGQVDLGKMHGFRRTLRAIYVDDKTQARPRAYRGTALIRNRLLLGEPPWDKLVMA
jgi:hypothetical protein